MKISPVSGDLVVKLALIAAAGVGLYLMWRNFNVGETARQAGNVVVDSTILAPVHGVATGVGDALVGTVNAIPGLTDYLRSISDHDAPQSDVIAPGVIDVNGQTFNMNF